MQYCVYSGNYHCLFQQYGIDALIGPIKPLSSSDHQRHYPIQQSLNSVSYTHLDVYKRQDHKLPYEPEAAAARVEAHAYDFVSRTRQRMASQQERMGPAPLIVSPYDAELFGHWWFEGPQWLETVVRRMADEPEIAALTTPSAYLSSNPSLQAATPSASSWGDGGYNAFWLNPGNDWIYPQLHEAARRMSDMARKHAAAKPGSLIFRALQQAGRSLLLAQASDWAFIMKTQTAKEYATRSTRDHLARFFFLEECIISTIDERRLHALEIMDQIFPDIDPAVFR